jgi:hypothetical protein
MLQLRDQILQRGTGDIANEKISDREQGQRYLLWGGIPMLHTLVANWWALALRGLVAVLFGLLTFFLPDITLVTLVLLFGAYALVDGIFNLIVFFRVASHHWALLIA